MTAKIGILDIETAPNVAHVWQLFKANVGLNQLMQSGHIIMWGGKIFGKPGVTLMDEHTDGYEKMLRGLYDFIEECDIIVAHNGDKFDMRWCNAEFLRRGWSPPDPAKTVDTLKVAKSRFYFPSYKLDYIVQELGLGAKVKHEGHELWVGWIAKDPRSIATMRRYCRGDVLLEEKLYRYFRPWINNHPNVGLYLDDTTRPVCSNCSSTKVVKKGLATTKQGLYQRYRCNNCGTPLRSKFTELPTEKRKHLLNNDR